MSANARSSLSQSREDTDLALCFQDNVLSVVLGFESGYGPQLGHARQRLRATQLCDVVSGQHEQS